MALLYDMTDSPEYPPVTKAIVGFMNGNNFGKVTKKRGSLLKHTRSAPKKHAASRLKAWPQNMKGEGNNPFTLL